MDKVNGDVASGSLQHADTAVRKLLMLTYLVWFILFVLCWPIAILALILYPVIWVLLLPVRIIGIAVGGVLDLLRALIYLPARVFTVRRP